MRWRLVASRGTSFVGMPEAVESYMLRARRFGGVCGYDRGRLESRRDFVDLAELAVLDGL